MGLGMAWLVRCFLFKFSCIIQINRAILFCIFIAQIINSEIDIAPAEFTITQNRSKAVDFLVPITQSHQRFFIKNPANSFNWMAFIEPLRNSAWLATFILLISFPPILAFLMLIGT